MPQDIARQMNRDHWIQFGAFILCLVAAVVGATAYLSRSIENVEISDLRTNNQMSQRVAADEARIAALEKISTEHYGAETAFMSEMRSFTSTQIQALADLKVELAGKENMRTR